jgi:hypothetical protein
MGGLLLPPPPAITQQHRGLPWLASMESRGGAAVGGGTTITKGSCSNEGGREGRAPPLERVGAMEGGLLLYGWEEMRMAWGVREGAGGG